MSAIRSGLFLTLIGSTCPTGAQTPQREFSLHIPRQTLTPALAQFASSTGLQVARFSDPQETKVLLNPVMGTYTAERALQLMFAGSGYSYRFINDHTIAITHSQPTDLATPRSGAAPSPAAEDTAGPATQPTARRLRLAAYIGALFASLSSPLWAQEADVAGTATATNTLEEVVVTSRRRAERLEDVPESITAFTSKSLEALDLKDTTDLALYTPGLEYSDYNLGRTDRSSNRQLIFRGLNLANGFGVTSGALIFLDGAPVLSGDVDVSPDIERVEVIRGPQNVYFGRSTFSGAVNYVTKAISPELSGIAESETASYDTYDDSLSVEGPIIGDKLSGRITGRVAANGGEYTNSFNTSEKLGARNTKELAGTLYADPTDWFNAKLYLNYTVYDDGTSASALIPSRLDNCAANPSQPATINYYCGTLPKANHVPIWIQDPFPASYGPLLFQAVGGGDNLIGHGDFTPKFGLQTDAFGSHLILNFSLPDELQLQSISAYHWAVQGIVGSRIEENVALNATPAPYLVSEYSFTEEYTDIYQELRLSSSQKQRIRWTVGSNYIFGLSEVQLPGLSQTAAQAAPIGARSFNSSTQTATAGLFAGVYADLIDPLTLSLEARYQLDDRKDGGSTRPQVFDQKTFRSWDPRASLEYKIDPDLMTYVSYSAGTRPGGFNANLLGQPAFVLNQIAAETGITGTSYKEEKLNTYELGLKGSAFEKRLQGSVDAYYGTLTDFQVTTNAPYITTAGQQISVTLTSNLGSVRIYGVEADARYLITPRLSISPTFAFTQTRILSLPCASCIGVIGTASVVGNELPMAPEFSGDIALEYNHPIENWVSWEWFLHGDYVYRKSMNVDYENLIKTGDQDIVNLRGGISNGKLRVEAFVTNLFNNLTVTGASEGADGVTGGPSVNVGLPNKQQFGVRLRYAF